MFDHGDDSLDPVAGASRDGAADTPDDSDCWNGAGVLDGVDLVVEVAALMSTFVAQRVVRIHAMRREAVAEVDRHGDALREITERSIRLELASALRVSEYAADRMIVQAEALVQRYPRVLQALEGALITERHADILIEFLDEAEPELRETLEPRALELAESHPVGTFRRLMRVLVDTARSVTLAERHEAALKQRRVVVELAADGMAWLSAHIPAVEAHAIYGRLTAISSSLGRQQDETRTLDQIRADALCDLLIEGETDAHPPEARGIRAQVAVTVPALSLLADEGEGGGATTDAPATVEGIGPIPISRARELCGAADGWMRILTHPESGMVVSVGRDRYRPPPALRRLVRWRAERCMAPGCGIPASRCEIDHTIAWECGGQTRLTNLTPLCKGHHTVKHHGGWRVRQIDDSGGALEWMSPTGRRYVVEPERRIPIFRAHADGDPPV